MQITSIKLQIVNLCYDILMTVLIDYKKARFEYEILEKYEAGIELLGFEVKSLKGKHGSLDGAYVIIRGGEAYIQNMLIPPYQEKNTPKDYEPRRHRRLLLKKKEIAELAHAGEGTSKGCLLYTSDAADE